MSKSDPRVTPPAVEQVPALVREGAARYNAGDFWEAHEAWEEAWHALRAGGLPQAADFLQGMILVTAAFENRKRGKEAGFKRQMANGLHRLRENRGRGDALGLAEEAAWVDALVGLYLDACRHRLWGHWAREGPHAPPLLVREG